MKKLTNNQNYLITVLTSLFNVGFSIIVSFLLVPISLSYWGSEKYGLWILLTTVLVYLNISNLGLNTAATVLIGKTPTCEIKIKLFWKTLRILMVSSSVFFIGFGLLNILDSEWVHLLGEMSAPLENEAYWTCLILGISFFINLPFSILSSLLIGTQHAYIENVFSNFRVIINIISIFIVISCSGTLIDYAVVYGLLNFLFNIVKGIFCFAYFRKHYKCLKRNNEEITVPGTGVILSLGMRFFFMYISSLIIQNTDNLLISNMVDLKNVTSYANTMKVYNMVFNIINIINSSMMPLIAKEYGVGNWRWIHNTYRYLFNIIIAFGGLVWLCGIWFAKDIIVFWAGYESYAGPVVVFILGAYSYILSIVNLNQNMLITLNLSKGIAVISFVEAILNISLSVYLVKHVGVAGAAAGTLLSTTLVGFWIGQWLLKERTKNTIRISGLELFKYSIVVFIFTFSAQYIRMKIGRHVHYYVLAMIYIFFYSFVIWYIFDKRSKRVFMIQIRKVLLRKRR